MGSLALLLNEGFDEKRATGKRASVMFPKNDSIASLQTDVGYGVMLALATCSTWIYMIILQARRVVGSILLHEYVQVRKLECIKGLVCENLSCTDRRGDVCSVVHTNFVLKPRKNTLD
jgi:hypothetical protein